MSIDRDVLIDVKNDPFLLIALESLSPLLSASTFRRAELET